MTATIHRPYFLPWMGYFSKLAYSDVFVVMDDVNFTKKHFIDRVKIINAQGGEMWLSLSTGENFNKKCNEIRLPSSFSVDYIMKTLSHSYSKSRFFKKYSSNVENILIDSFSESSLLVEFDMKIVELIMEFLSIEMPIIFWGSQFEYVSDATERLLLLCKKTNSSKIIMGSGGSTDKHDLNKLRKNGIDILYQDFWGNHPTYYQTRRERIGFAKGLSVVDCIFNEGIEITRQLILDIKNKPYIL